MKNLITVVIPLFKVENCLSKCLKSIINQTYKNIEIIIIDNTNDKSFKEIYTKFAKIDNRIKIITTKSKNINNIALSTSHGDFIHFISSCDYISPSYYEKMLSSVLSNNSDIAISGFKTKNYNLYYSSKGICKTVKEKVSATQIYKYDFIFRYLIRKELLNNHKIKFNTNSMQDMVFLMQVIFFANNISIVPRITYFTGLS